MKGLCTPDPPHSVNVLVVFPGTESTSTGVPESGGASSVLVGSWIKRVMRWQTKTESDLALTDIIREIKGDSSTVVLCIVYKNRAKELTNKIDNKVAYITPSYCMVVLDE